MNNLVPLIYYNGGGPIRSYLLHPEVGPSEELFIARSTCFPRRQYLAWWWFARRFPYYTWWERSAHAPCSVRRIHTLSYVSHVVCLFPLMEADLVSFTYKYMFHKAGPFSLLNLPPKELIPSSSCPPHAFLWGPSSLLKCPCIRDPDSLLKDHFVLEALIPSSRSDLSSLLEVLTPSWRCCHLQGADSLF